MYMYAFRAPTMYIKHYYKRRSANLIEGPVFLVLVRGSPEDGGVDVQGAGEGPLYRLGLASPLSLLCKVWSEVCKGVVEASRAEGGWVTISWRQVGMRMKYECVGVYTCTHGVCSCTCMGERKTTKHMEYEGGVPEGGKHRGYVQ